MRLGVCKNSAVLSINTCITLVFSDQNLFGYTADIITDRANKIIVGSRMTLNG